MESEIEIDVVDLSNDSNLIVEESGNIFSLAVKSKEKNKQQQQQRGHAQNTKNRIDEDDEVIDVEEIEEDDTFLTIGNNITRIAKSNAVVGKSPVSSKAESFIMSESLVLEGTRHKSMSPEFGSSSDSGQNEPDARAKKSKIPIPQKGLTNTKPAQQRATRGRKKNAVEEPQTVETGDAEADEKEGIEQRGLLSKRKEQVISARGRKEAHGKGKPEAEEVQNTGTNEKEESRATSLPGKRQQVKSTRRGERKVTVSDEGDESSALDIKHGKKRARGKKGVSNITQKQTRITRGRKQKCDTENMDNGAAEVINADSDGKKLAGHRTKQKEGAEDKKRAEQNGSAADRSEQPDNSKTAEFSGRKTRAQRKKEKDDKVNDVSAEGKGIEVVVDNLEIEEVESENMGSLEMEEEIEKSEKESKAKSEEKTKKNKLNDGVGNERNLTQAYSKKAGRKSQSVGRDKTLGEGDGQDLTGEVKDASKVNGGVRGKGKKTQLAEGTEHDAEQEEKGDALDIVEDLADVQASSSEHVSVTDITNVSSNSSSGSESMKNVITGIRRKRRKRSRILPPYATKRLPMPSKGNNSKSSSTINSHDSMSGTEAKKRRLQVEGNQTSVVKEKSSRKGATTNPRIAGRAKRPERASVGATKSVAQDHKKESLKHGHGLSDATVENSNNDDNVIDNAASVAADEVGIDDPVQEETGVENNPFESVLVHGTGTKTPAQPVTALKSILKSGGSVVQAATGTDTRYGDLSISLLHSTLYNLLSEQKIFSTPAMGDKSVETLGRKI